jgi:hypothetical protein
MTCPVLTSHRADYLVPAEIDTVDDRNYTVEIDALVLLCELSDLKGDRCGKRTP